ncbi:MBL fold metallo-hydrolase [Dysgonomonas sp. Marseille-P4361]|uniref:MBL fold metallo-hydrolase n=1 Tax=Dysgonomonas sp. Marseille-P4361 TaxID=2161820 RepID=UPI000D555D46|nr:MBL fold metallo-hydrolase [Dysgonomonas sp. Marseille-P4361]
MNIKFLGTGTSSGIPEIGCGCEVCTSNNIKDRRLRASVLLNINGIKILIDCGPDFRQQILPEPFSPLDGILLTHEHYDHVGGLDDLRIFSKLGKVHLYANGITLDAIRRRMPYSFSENPYPGVPVFTMHEVDKRERFSIAGVQIIPIEVKHYKLPVLGYRVANFVYLTDVKTIPEEEYCKLEGVDVLVINALRKGEHMSHLSLYEALAIIEKVSPKRAYLTHISHDMGLHEEVEKELPENVLIAYDGLEIKL